VIVFVQLFFSSGVYYEDVIAQLFTLTLDGRSKKWCYYLPTSSIHSFKQPVNALCEFFDKYDYKMSIIKSTKLE